MNLTTVGVPINIAAGLYCSFLFAGHTIGFEAPIDFVAGDVVQVDTRDGQPWAVWRDGVTVWTYEPPKNVIRLTGTWDEDAARTMAEAFGR